MSIYKSYKVCQGCNCGIVRGGVVVREKRGFGFSHNKKYYHRACLKHKYGQINRNFFANMFRAVRKYGEVDVDYSQKFLGIKL